MIIFMGLTNSTPIDTMTESDYINFKLLIDSLWVNHKETSIIIETGSRFDFKYEGMTFYHYLVANAFLLSRTSLQTLCDLIYEYRHKFGSVETVSDHKFAILTYDKGKFYREWKNDSGRFEKVRYRTIMWGPGPDECLYRTIDEWKPYKDCYDLSNITPLTFCLSLKNQFLPKYELEDHFDIVIDLFNKLSNKNPKNNPLKCVLCKEQNKDIIIKPCMHACICQDCLKTRTTCPICQGLIISSDKFIL